VRLLTNLETAKQKLLQIILIGQPELRELLARNDLRQLAQRITGRYHLEPLSEEETTLYIEHRLKVAGALGEVFENSAKKATYRLSKGVPRLINVICDRALLGAYSLESRRVNRQLVHRAAAEVRGRLEQSPWIRPVAAAAGLVGLVIIAASIWSVTRQTGEQLEMAAAPAEAGAAEPLTEELNAAPDENTVVVELPEAQPALNEQLQLASGLTNRSFALTSLFDAWDLEYKQGSQSGCAQASDAGLACLYQRGSWSGLKKIDRPAILTLVDDSGESHEVVLLAIHGATAELSISGVRVTHPVESITNAWFGQYMLLWRPPSGQAVSLGLGSRGPEVLWLRESLATIDQQFTSRNTSSDAYDADLEQVVRAFQRAHRLNVDGLAGQQTQIIINSLLGADSTPRLTTPRLAQD
jgi:general secretion pathway protein A